MSKNSKPPIPVDEDNQPTILIVDDERINITALTNLLHFDNYNIVIAKNGKQALLRVFNDNPPDLILLDVMMPKMNGFEVCEEIQKHEKYKNIPIIFITALFSEEDEIKAFNAGAVDFIIKPFRTVVVRARVKTHLELKRRGDMLERLSTLDGLTGIPNRRRLDEFVQHEWNSAIRSQQPLSLLMMDIDFFKLFNDNYGHGIGDKCLKRVAKALKETLQRSTDLVARYGGEEFMAVLPAADINVASIIAKRMMDSIKKLKIPHRNSTVAKVLTISLGSATIVPQKELQLSSLLAMADHNLYQAKERGRNQIVMEDNV